jgi:hypothetical protein
MCMGCCLTDGDEETKTGRALRLGDVVLHGAENAVQLNLVPPLEEAATGYMPS